ncbi:MAG: ketol-acid reductoisomerase [Nocardioidaceae bacterium]
MVEVWHDDDAELRHVQARNVAVLGAEYESLAHALCLRDSGVDVRIGLIDSGAGVACDMEGMPAVSPYDACEESDLIMVLASSAVSPSLFGSAVEPNLVAGDALLFRSGFEIRYGSVRPPSGVDVGLVAPQASARLLRREFSEGRGVPMLVAVETDASHTAWELTLSYAKAIGGTRAGAIKTTFAEEAETFLFGGQGVLGDAVTRFVEAGFQTLMDAGHPPEIAYLQSVHQLKLIVDALHSGGRSDGQPPTPRPAALVADTAACQLVDDSVRDRLRQVLDTITRTPRIADFPGVGLGDSEPGPPPARTRSEEASLESAGREVRARMSWLDAFWDDPL